MQPRLWHRHPGRARPRNRQLANPPTCYYFKHMRAVVLLLFLAVVPPALHADDYIVDFDRRFDFSTARTFAIGGTTVRINRPEISNPLVIERATAAIRTALIA